MLWSETQPIKKCFFISLWQSWVCVSLHKCMWESLTMWWTMLHLKAYAPTRKEYSQKTFLCLWAFLCPHYWDIRDPYASHTLPNPPEIQRHMHGHNSFSQQNKINHHIGFRWLFVTISAREVWVTCLILPIKLIQGFTQRLPLNPKLKNNM